MTYRRLERRGAWWAWELRGNPVLKLPITVQSHFNVSRGPKARESPCRCCIEAPRADENNGDVELISKKIIHEVTSSKSQ